MNNFDKNNHLKKKEILLMLLLAATTVVVAVPAFVSSLPKPLLAAHTDKPTLLAVSTQSVMGTSRDFRGVKTAPYTLVEFADYQCPPCARVNKEVSSIVAKYSDKLRFQFRNFPLVEIHPMAMASAIAAEAARQQSQFWPMHDALYSQQENLSNDTIKHLVRQCHLDEERFYADCATNAKKVVQADLRFAEEVDLHSTPTFLLCCPNGQVIKLERLEQINEQL